MRWETPFFVHLAVPPEQVAARLPAGLELDPDAGDATVSLVALGAVGPAPRFVERSPLARLVRYDQLNVRTYVKGPRGRGLYFFESRVDRLWPTVARIGGWPYRVDRELAFTADPQGVAVKAAGIDVKGLPSPELPALPEKDSLERSLLERYLSYGSPPAGPLYVVRVGHRPWRVRAVALDPDVRLDLGELGVARPISAQLAESLDVTVDEIMPAVPAAGRVRRALGAATLRLVWSSP
jgi:uncharacterized protein YqjF (DUF2071 family)